jgi:phage tail tape-measure protein
MSTPATCLICGADLERPPTGRPPTYCGRVCQRLAKNERRRLDRQLGNLERFTSNLRMMGGARHFRRELTHAQAEIERIEARLRTLLVG